MATTFLHASVTNGYGPSFMHRTVPDSKRAPLLGPPTEMGYYGPSKIEISQPKPHYPPCRS